MKFAVTQIVSSGMIAISGCPGCTIWPTSTDLRLTMPLTGAFTVAYCRFSSAWASVGLGLLRVRLGRRRPRFRRGHLLRTGLRGLQFGMGLLFAGARLDEPAFGDADAGFGLGDLRARRIGRRLLRFGCADGAVELLLRDLVLGEQALQPLDVARRLRGVCLRLAHARLGRRQPRARGVELALGPEHAALRLCDAAVRGRDVAGRCRRRDRHIALGGNRVRFGIGQLGARLLEGHLIVARIDLDEHVAGVDLLVVGDRHPKDRAADTRGDLRHMRIHLRIVGRLAPRGDPVPDRRRRRRRE